MTTTLEDIEKAFTEKVAAATSIDALTDISVHFLGRKGLLTEKLRDIKHLSLEEKKELGQKTNAFKKRAANILAEKKEALAAEQYARLGDTAWQDPSTPSAALPATVHPITAFMKEAEKVFSSLGFSISHGPQVEDDWHNFTALNIPADHPARDGHDTLFLSGHTDALLRTHTSTCQIRFAEKTKPPFRVIVPGRVYRKDDFDASHSPAFHQLEGMMIGEGVTLTDMKGIIELSLKKLLSVDMQFRWRTSFFPFVEPGLELDISTPHVAGGAWLEVLGCGMTHPTVLENVGIDPKKYQGFAFGFGIDRLVMLKHGISDIRLLYENDLRFLRQF